MRLFDASIRHYLLCAGCCVCLHALLSACASGAATPPSVRRGAAGEPARVAATGSAAVAESLEVTDLAVPRVEAETSLLVPRRDGPYIKYGAGNAAVLISFVSGLTYGVKTTCSNPALASYVPQVCVAAIFGSLVLDFLAAFLLEGRAGTVFNPHGLHLDMTHGEMRARILESLNRTEIGQEGVYIGGQIEPEAGGEVRVYYYELEDGLVGHRAEYYAAAEQGNDALGRRATERRPDGTMEYQWKYDNRKRWNHTDKNGNDVKSASKSAAYDWYFNHGNTNRACGGPVTDSGRLLDDVGIWYAGQKGGGSYPFQPGESAAEIAQCAADLGAAGYSTNV